MNKSNDNLVSKADDIKKRKYLLAVSWLANTVPSPVVNKEKKYRKSISIGLISRTKIQPHEF